MTYDIKESSAILHLTCVTPAIRAIFGAVIRENYPDTGQAYIKCFNDRDASSWNAILQRLETLRREAKLPITSEYPLCPQLRSIQGLLNLAEHLPANSNVDLRHLLQLHTFKGHAQVDELFEIARFLNDGHNLSAIEVVGCWYSTSPRLHYLGGFGRFFSDEIQVSRYSNEAIDLGAALRCALLHDNMEEAARQIAMEIGKLAGSIMDVSKREDLMRRAISLASGSP